jgi:4-diphosphocytidyl-2-C-methyl-D-erythritol kinase
MKAYAKLNLALVVGPLQEAGKHEVVTVLQAIDLHDDVDVEPAAELTVEGLAEDTLVRDALVALADAAGVEPAWRARLEKRIPLAAGLGGGSSDAAAALRLANELLPVPLPADRLRNLAARLGADVPFFLASGPQLGTGDGSTLAPLRVPLDYTALVALPSGAPKESTAAVYRDFDGRNGADGFDVRRDRLTAALGQVGTAADLARLPANDLARSDLAARLAALGAFRADVSGAGPAVYGLFARREDADRAAAALAEDAQTWVTRPVEQGRPAQTGKMTA